MELFPTFCLVCDKHIDTLSSGDGLYCSAKCRALESAPEVLRLQHLDGHKHSKTCGCSFSYPSILSPLPLVQDELELDNDLLDLNDPICAGSGHSIPGLRDHYNEVPDLCASSPSDIEEDNMNELGYAGPRPISPNFIPASNSPYSTSHPEDIYSRTVMLNRPTASLLAMESQA